MNLFTSYYSSPLLKKVSLKKVSISRGVPKWFTPDVIYMPLAPSWQLIRISNEEEYTARYQAEVLDKLNVNDVLSLFQDGAILLCWEPVGKFCHRRLVAEWIQNNTGIVVPELSMEHIKNTEKGEQRTQILRQALLFA